MQAQGMAVDADVLSAASSLSTSQSQLNQLDAGIEQIRKMLCSFTGYDEAANPVFGEVPSADPSYIATVNVTEDKEKAVNNNYNLISLRSQTGGGMTDLRSVPQRLPHRLQNKLRNVEYSEENVRSNIQALYDEMEEKERFLYRSKDSLRKRPDRMAGSTDPESKWYVKQYPVHAAGISMAAGTVRI